MKKIIFVYNADSSLFSGITDSVHKIVSPGTYKCNLCKLTYGSVFIKKDWKEFIEGLSHEIKFLHRDEISKDHPELTEFPLVLLQEGDNMKIIATPNEINQAKTINDLKQVVKTALTRI